MEASDSSSWSSLRHQRLRDKYAPTASTFNSDLASLANTRLASDTTNDHTRTNNPSHNHTDNDHDAGENDAGENCSRTNNTS
jgi:hypothetical protein